MVNRRTLEIMATDAASGAAHFGRRTADYVTKGKNDFLENVRICRRFGRGASEGYLKEQILTSVFPLYDELESKFFESDHKYDAKFDGEMAGFFVGSIQDSATLLLAAAYFTDFGKNVVSSFGDVNEAWYAGGAILVGAKVVSNLGAKLYKWYDSARSRSQPDMDA